MRTMNGLTIIKTITHILLTIVIIIFILSGFGITNYQIIGPATAGLLTKPVSFQLHTNLIIPLLVLLTAHIAFTLEKKLQKKQHT
jgi:hypothetical protein